VQRPRPLADEVRRRGEPRLPRDAAAWEQTDSVVAKEPGGGFGRIPRVRVFRQENDQRVLEPFVQRCEQRRQRRLRDTGARRQRLGELGETLVLDEFSNECVEYRAVHDEGRNRRFR
jgi:hypothetical protein